MIILIVVQMWLILVIGVKEGTGLNPPPLPGIPIGGGGGCLAIFNPLLGTQNAFLNPGFGIILARRRRKILGNLHV